MTRPGSAGEARTAAAWNGKKRQCWRGRDCCGREGLGTDRLARRHTDRLGAAGIGKAMTGRQRKARSVRGGLGADGNGRRGKNSIGVDRTGVEWARQARRDPARLGYAWRG